LDSQSCQQCADTNRRFQSKALSRTRTQCFDRHTWLDKSPCLSVGRMAPESQLETPSCLLLLATRRVSEPSTFLETHGVRLPFFSPAAHDSRRQFIARSE